MKNKILSIFVLLVMIISSTSYAYTSLTIWNDNDTSETNSTPLKNYLSIESESAILIEMQTGQVLFEKDSHKQLRPASVTKIMSILLIMEALDRGEITLETQVSCSENSSSMGGSQIWLDTTETLSVHDMLKAISVVSANDCTVAMAEHLCGSEELFVQKMNERAKELGMNDTTFKNCHGIDEDGHFTSSYDISIMSRELLLNHPEITEYTTIWMDTLRDGKSELVNTNKLIRTYEGATGLKTGSTSLALYNLSASATRNNLSLISVVLKAPTPTIRFSEAKLLLDYGFNNYCSKTLANAGDIFQSINVEKGVVQEANVVYETSPSFILEKNKESLITSEVTLNDTVSAPITKGQQLGYIKYFCEENELKTINLIAESSIEKISFLSLSKHILSKWFTLLK